MAETHGKEILNRYTTSTQVVRKNVKKRHFRHFYRLVKGFKQRRAKAQQEDLRLAEREEQRIQLRKYHEEADTYMMKQKGWDDAIGYHQFAIRQFIKNQKILQAIHDAGEQAKKQKDPSYIILPYVPDPIPEKFIKHSKNLSQSMDIMWKEARTSLKLPQSYSANFEFRDSTVSVGGMLRAILDYQKAGGKAVDWEEIDGEIRRIPGDEIFDRDEAKRRFLDA